MKAYHIKDLLKKDLLIIELPEDNWLSVFPRFIWICDRETNEYHHIKGSYTLLGKPDEIIEDDAMELVQCINVGTTNKYIASVEFFNNVNNRYYETAKESLLSAIESLIFWENPHGKFPRYNFDESVNPNDIKARFYYQKWHEAELRTFDRSRSIILVKQ